MSHANRVCLTSRLVCLTARRVLLQTGIIFVKGQKNRRHYDAIG
jgi:hypothetical protein